MVKNFLEERNLSLEDNFKLMQEVRRSTLTRTSLLTIKEKDNNAIRIAADDQNEVSQVRIQMGKIGILDKINIHKQASDIFYSYFLKSYLNKSKLENKVTKLEGKIKREKSCNQGLENESKEIGSRSSSTGIKGK